MGVCCCARSSPLRAQKRQVLACPALYRTGAPRSMKMGTVLSPYRYDAGARHALQSSRNAAVPRGFEWHMLAGGDGTAWLAFLNTVRTERFDQVLALRPASAGHREGRVGQGPRKRKARTSGLAKPSEPAPHERAALDAYLAPKKQVCAASRVRRSYCRYRKSNCVKPQFCRLPPRNSAFLCGRTCQSN